MLDLPARSGLAGVWSVNCPDGSTLRARPSGERVRLEDAGQQPLREVVKGLLDLLRPAAQLQFAGLDHGVVIEMGAGHVLIGKRPG